MAQYDRRDGGTASLIAVGVVILVAVVSVAAFIIINLGGNVGKNQSNEVPSIETDATPDAAAKNGMIDGGKYDGEKNPDGILSYRINGNITVEGGKGDLMIENPPKNTCLMIARIVVDGQIVYESGYLLPNQYIDNDELDIALEVGEYTAKAELEGFDPGTLESLGTVETEISIIVK